MTWKNFKNWLEKNITTSDGLVVKIRPEKQSKYSKLSTWTLTNFCDSLEATLDKNTSYHLFPNFSENKSFEELFNSAYCYLGKRTNQEKTNESDYSLLEKIFYEWKQSQQGTENIAESNNQPKKGASWKEFNRWLQKEVIIADGLQAKIREEKKSKYGKISIITLTNFCDSLEATLDKNNSYHLFPTFGNNKSFEEIFIPFSCRFGKKTNGEKVKEVDYVLLESLFNEWKSTQENTRENINELKKLLGDSKKEVIGYKIKIQEDKLEKLTQNLKISREKVRNLSKAYQKLVRTQAQENFDYDIVLLMEEKIEKIKDELLSGGWLTWKVSLENVQKLCSKCEKIAKLQEERNKLCKEQFEARQEVLSNNNNLK